MIIQVGQAIGALWTVLILIVDSLIGARLLSWQGRRAWAAFQAALTEGRIPHREVLDGVLIIVGGAFLLTPGFITDAVGLLLLIPPTRAAFRRPADPHDAAPDPARVGARGGRRRRAGRGHGRNPPRTRRHRHHPPSCPRRGPTRRSDDRPRRRAGADRPRRFPRRRRRAVAGRVAAGRGANRSSSLGRPGERDARWCSPTGEPVLEIGGGDRRRRGQLGARGGRAAAAHDRAATASAGGCCSTRRAPGSSWSCTR